MDDKQLRCAKNARTVTSKRSTVRAHSKVQVERMHTFFLKVSIVHGSPQKLLRATMCQAITHTQIRSLQAFV